MITLRMQQEYVDAYQRAAYFPERIAGLYIFRVKRLGECCFRDEKMADFVMRTISVHHPFDFKARSFRAFYEFSTPYIIPLKNKPLLLADVVREILKENNNDLYQKYLRYSRTLSTT